MIETQDRVGIVIEVKYANDGKLGEWCEKALAQMEKNSYSARLVEDGMKKNVKYGVVFYKKSCKVVLG